ncbi:MAG: ankyrin repeat domain-containing protein [Armatimonadota bacterium]
MSEKLPENADVRQLRTRAKELLRTLPAGSKLADAQLSIARQYGFDSWPKLIAEVETPVLLDQFRRAIDEGDAAGLERLLANKPALRKRVNDPMFAFDAQPIIQAVRHREAARLLPILVRHGADPNARTMWWAGGFSALDFARGSTVDVLLGVGARFDVWSASVQGRLDVLRELLDADPASVNAPGGDGQRPLHVAANAEIAALLIKRGADLEIRDTDHESTPIQYHINNLPVVRELLRHGATPDVFTAVVLDDVELMRSILETDPKSASVHVGEAPFVTTKSNGGHIYAYQLGPTKTPLQVAIERGSQAVAAELQRGARAVDRLIAAAWAEDESLVEKILAEEPAIEIGASARMITEAPQAGKAETVRLLLRAGFDPTTPGMDSGSALHVACWFGYVEVVRMLVDKVPLDLRDAHHGSPPLGWACHGAQWCRNPKGDYVAVVRELIGAGADSSSTANSGGTSMIEQAGKRTDVIAVLKQYL